MKRAIILFFSYAFSFLMLASSYHMHLKGDSIIAFFSIFPFIIFVLIQMLKELYLCSKKHIDPDKLFKMRLSFIGLWAPSTIALGASAYLIKYEKDFSNAFLCLWLVIFVHVASKAFFEFKHATSNKEA